MLTETEEKKYDYDIEGNRILSNGEKELNGDEEWEKIWANPLAYEVLEELGRQASEDLKNGLCEPGRIC